MIDSNIIINKGTSLIEALQRMDEIRHKLLIICEGKKFCGLITIGDIQRALLKKIDLNKTVDNFVRTDLLIASSKTSLAEVKSVMQEKRLEYMPIVDDGLLIDIIEWDELFGTTKVSKKFANPIPVVIMAGGKGERLKPLTNILPKPLVPISQKTIIEDIMDKFVDVGCDEFYISLNYKADIIEQYLHELSSDRYKLNFFHESKPLGTAGPLSLVKSYLDKTFFLSNCDILVDIEFEDLWEYHVQNENLITIVSAIKSISIPYGTLETREKGQLITLHEKPEILTQINSGLYVIEPRIFHYIEDNAFIHITEVINLALQNGERIGVFPVSEGSWVDMGNWNEYLKVIKTEEINK